MSHGICNRCGYPIAEPAPDYVRCGNAHPRLADLAEFYEAFRTEGYCTDCWVQNGHDEKCPICSHPWYGEDTDATCTRCGVNRTHGGKHVCAGRRDNCWYCVRDLACWRHNPAVLRNPGSAE